MAERTYKGHTVLFDDEDGHFFSDLDWYVSPNKTGVYVFAVVPIDGVRTRTIMAHHILGTLGEGHYTVYRDYNPLNLCRDNLIDCPNRSLVAAHAKDRQDRQMSHFRGVRRHRSGKWRVVIQVNGHYLHGGLHVTEEDAGRAYDTLALFHFGAAAALNFPVHRGA